MKVTRAFRKVTGISRSLSPVAAMVLALGLVVNWGSIVGTRPVQHRLTPSQIDREKVGLLICYRSEANAYLTPQVTPERLFQICVDQVVGQ